MISELADLPVIPVDEVPVALVLKNGPELVGWAFVFPDGSAWIVKADARSVIHSGSVRTLVNFWSQVFDCEVGIPQTK
ncbi:hypothetical protein ABGB16_02115 [Micromonospora sp. B11E3]|uniref:hypothetical protein n=1 Tax=Micromonospora sp. B11E3 TaxID=3153562 RepID=UPI00325ECA22